MATEERNYKYIIFDIDENAYGMDDAETAQHASDVDECIVIETKTGRRLDTGLVIAEYPLYEDENEPSDL